MSRFSRRKEAQRVAKAAGGKFKVAASLKELERLKNEIPFYPLELMAKYVDGVTSKTANDLLLHASVGDEMRAMSDGELYHACTATAFGNAGFLVLNSGYEKIQKDCQELIDRMKLYILFLNKAPELDENGFFDPNK